MISGIVSLLFSRVDTRQIWKWPKNQVQYFLKWGKYRRSFSNRTSLEWADTCVRFILRCRWNMFWLFANHHKMYPSPISSPSSSSSSSSPYEKMDDLNWFHNNCTRGYNSVSRYRRYIVHDVKHLFKKRSRGFLYGCSLMNPLYHFYH